jgi:hypothetical protein
MFTIGRCRKYLSKSVFKILICCSMPLPGHAPPSKMRENPIFFTYTLLHISNLKIHFFLLIFIDSYTQNKQKYPLKKEMFYYIPKGPFLRPNLRALYFLRALLYTYCANLYCKHKIMTNLFRYRICTNFSAHTMVSSETRFVSYIRNETKLKKHLHNKKLLHCFNMRNYAN